MLEEMLQAQGQAITAIGARFSELDDKMRWMTEQRRHQERRFAIRGNHIEQIRETYVSFTEDRKRDLAKRNLDRGQLKNQADALGEGRAHPDSPKLPGGDRQRPVSVFEINTCSILVLLDLFLFLFLS
jgi:hypothetical protein